MALANTLPFSGLKVLLESATTAGTFVAPCGLKERSLTLTKETGETVVPDCDNEDAGTFVERDVTSKSAQISGQGVLARESLSRWRAAYETDTPVKVRTEIAGTSAQGGGYWLGLYHLTSFELGGTRGERCTVTVELQSSGPVTFTPAV